MLRSYKLSKIGEQNRDGEQGKRVGGVRLSTSVKSPIAAAGKPMPKKSFEDARDDQCYGN